MARCVPVWLSPRPLTTMAMRTPRAPDEDAHIDPSAAGHPARRSVACQRRLFEQRIIGLGCHARILADLHGVDQHRPAAVTRAGTVFGDDRAVAGDHLLDIGARARVGAGHAVSSLARGGRRLRGIGRGCCGLFGRRRFGAFEPITAKRRIEGKAANREKAKTGGDAAKAQKTRTLAAGFAVAAQRRMQVRSQFFARSKTGKQQKGQGRARCPALT